jgi:hypothetical protein
VEGKPSPTEIQHARKLFSRVKNEIDDNDRPVVLWGLVVPEYGIITGYQGESYLVSTFRHLTNQPEDPILFYDLQAPGGLEAFFFKNKVKPDPESLGWKTLERATRFAEGKDPTLDNYVVGPKALDEWANILESRPEEEQNYHGNSYVAACVWESHAISGEFLKRLANRHPQKPSEQLLAAADRYEQATKLMREVTQIFPFKFQGEMKLNDRTKAATLLRKVKPLEEDAIGRMKNALKLWETQ